MGIQLGFGYSRGIPDGVTTAWGARLIAPAGLLPDRQDLVAEDDEAKRQLISWLNGSDAALGALGQALTRLRQWDFPDGEEFIVFADHRGRIVGNTNQSGGYVYLAGWLEPLI